MATTKSSRGTSKSASTTASATSSTTPAPKAAAATPAKKTAAKKAAGKTATTKTAAGKTATTKTAGKRTATTKTATTKTASTKAATTKAAAGKTATKKTTAGKTTAGKTTAGKTTATKTTATKAGARFVVREDESPWTTAELAQVRRELDDEIVRLREELDVAAHDLVDLMRDTGDGAGDEADVGSKTFEREQETSLANNARAVLEQNEHALERLEDGSYGVCEACGQPIGKLRLQAYPRATLCVRCKSRQERR